MDHEQFYVGQKAFIEKDGKVLVLINPHHEIDFPGGRIEISDNLDLNKSIKREVLEETNLEIEVVRPVVSWTKIIERDVNKGKPLLVIAYHCLYKSGEIKLSHEHNQYSWMDLTEIDKLSKEDDYYQYLLAYFQYRQAITQQV